MVRRATAVGLSASLILMTAWASADVVDPAASRAQLEQGYALKQKGKCEEAIPHFVESVRLDKHSKGLLNLADCEEKLGKLSAALDHFVQARDLAYAEGAEPLAKLAEQRLHAIEQKLPKLVVKVAKNAPPGTVVLRDGVELGAVSLGTPLPLDPGAHTIVVRGGSLERQYTVTLAEGTQQELEVTPLGGTRLATPSEKQPSSAQSSAPAAPPATAKGAPVFSTDETSASTSADTSHMSGRRVAALVSAGVGVVGVGVASALFFSAKSSWQQANDRCAQNVCQNPQDQQQGNDARSRANLSILPLGVGVAGLVAAGVLWFTDKPAAGSGATTATTIHIVPEVATRSGGIYLEGGF